MVLNNMTYVGAGSVTAGHTRARPFKADTSRENATVVNRSRVCVVFAAILGADRPHR